MTPAATNDSAPGHRPLRAGLVGFGNIGRMFARFLQTKRGHETRLVGACDPNPEARRMAQDEFGLPASETIDGVLTLRPDLVIIASISSVHAGQVIAAAEAGCHVLCEKPIALTLADADRAIGAVERAGVVAQVNYSLRYIEAYRVLRTWVRDGRFGRILSVSHARTRGFGLYGAGARHPAVVAPDVSGGWTVHHACHGLDLLYWLNGAFRSISAGTATTAANGSEEVVQAVVTFANGAIGHVSDSVCGIRDHYTQIIGSAGSAVLTGEREHTQLRFHAEGAGDDELVAVRDAKDHGVALDQFFACVREGRPSPDSLADARPSLAAALAAQESARTGWVVSLL
ncbi:MAG TPA: Gfo/Idh/MocA family oxidoreductase [Opitutaceae bacterium]|nr:Gfo/Idh/MocA family oxidoreductase [Opitutaceae bacterium]